MKFKIVGQTKDYDVQVSVRTFLNGLTHLKKV